MTVEILSSASPVHPLQAALALTPQSPSADVYALIAQAARLPDFPRGITGVIADRTGLSQAKLLSLEPELQRLARCARPNPAAALALDVIEDTFASGGYLRRMPSGDLWRFSGTHWTPLAKPALRSMITQKALGEPTAYDGAGVGVISQAINFVESLAIDGSDLAMEAPPPVINTLSSEVWIGPGGSVDVRPHRPESALRHVLPVRFDPSATCPRFDAAIGEIFAKAVDPERLAAHFDELAGYAIQPVRDLATSLFLRGGGANGKSTLVRVLMAVVGPDQVYAGSIEKLRGDQFVLPELAGKLVFVEEDARDGAGLDEGLLKQLTENTALSTRRAHSPAGFRFRSTVMPIIALNGALSLADSSYGLERRVRVIPFERRFSPEEIDPRIADKIITEELPGVLNRFIAGLQRLRARGTFAEPQECVEARTSLLVASDPLRAFLEEEAELVPGGRSRLVDFYAEMLGWARRQKRTVPFGRNSLKAKLEGQGYLIRKSAGHAIVEGVRLRARAELG